MKRTLLKQIETIAQSPINLLEHNAYQPSEELIKNRKIICRENQANLSLDTKIAVNNQSVTIFQASSTSIKAVKVSLASLAIACNISRSHVKLILKQIQQKIFESIKTIGQQIKLDIRIGFLNFSRNSSGSQVYFQNYSLASSGEKRLNIDMSVMTPATRAMENSIDSFSFYQNSPRSKSLVQRNNKNLLYKKLDDRIQRNQFGQESENQLVRSKCHLGRKNGQQNVNYAQINTCSQIDLRNSKREQLLQNMKNRLLIKRQNANDKIQNISSKSRSKQLRAGKFLNQSMQLQLQKKDDMDDQQTKRSLSHHRQYSIAPSKFSSPMSNVNKSFLKQQLQEKDRILSPYSSQIYKKKDLNTSSLLQSPKSIDGISPLNSTLYSSNGRISFNYISQYPAFLRKSQYYPVRRLEDEAIKDVREMAMKRHQANILSLKKEQTKVSRQAAKLQELLYTDIIKQKQKDLSRIRTLSAYRSDIQSQMLSDRNRRTNQEIENKEYAKPHFGPQQTQDRTMAFIEKEKANREIVKSWLDQQIQGKKQKKKNEQMQEKQQAQNANNISDLAILNQFKVIDSERRQQIERSNRAFQQCHDYWKTQMRIKDRKQMVQGVQSFH